VKYRKYMYTSWPWLYGSNN